MLSVATLVTLITHLPTPQVRVAAVNISRRAAQERGGAGVGLEEPVEDLQGRRLARAVGAQETVDDP